jgi:hypothetical protein
LEGNDDVLIEVLPQVCLEALRKITENPYSG